MVGGINTFGGLVPTYTGLVDEVRVWDTALTSNDVQSIYANTVPEPGSVVLMVSGALAILGLRRRVR